MKNKSKMKKILVSVTGVTLALLLLVGSNLGLYSKASEAESFATSEAAIDPNSEVTADTNSEDDQVVSSAVESSETVESASSSQETTSKTAEVTSASSVSSVSTSEIEEEEDDEEVSYGPVSPVTYDSSSESVKVTRDNFLTYFTLNGKARWDPAVGEVIFTDQMKQASAVTLKDKFDVNYNFQIKGEAWLGDQNQRRADGIAIGFHQGAASEVGGDGWNMGIGHLKEGFGFKFDTFDNSNTEQVDPDVDTMSSDGSLQPEFLPPSAATPKSKNYDYKPFGAFMRNQDYYHSSLGKPARIENNIAVTDLGSVPADRPKLLPVNDLAAGQYIPFTIIYDGTSKEMIVTADFPSGTMQWKRNVADWIGSATELSVIISASTGDPFDTRQKLKFESFEYVANADLVFDANGGSPAPSSINARVGSQVDLSSHTINNPSRFGYVFEGWFDASNNKLDPTATIEMPPGGVTYTAKWKANEYTLKFDAGNTAGTVDATGTMGDQVVAYNDATSYTGTAINANGFTKEGYTLTGWKAQIGSGSQNFAPGGQVKNLSSTDGDVFTFVAQWKENQYTLNFLANGDSDGLDISGTTASLNPTYTQTITIPNSGYTRKGYTFSGKWNTQADGKGDSYSVDQVVSKLASSASDLQTVNLYAQWNPVEYTITFDGNGNGDTVTGVPGNIKQAYRTPITTYPTVAPVRAGYVFAGWEASDGSTPASTPTMPLNGTKFVAKWTTETYLIKFDKNSGTDAVSNMPGDISGGYRTSVSYTSLKVPTRTGYTFKEWRTADNKTLTDVPTMPMNGTIFFAQWDAVKYTITFDGKGDGDTVANVPSNITQGYDTVITTYPTTDPTRDGYTFKGWETSDGKTFTDISKMPLNGAKFDAKWEAKEYAIEFDGNGDGDTVTNVPGQIKLSYRKAVTYPTGVPTRDGYSFAGWYTAGDEPTSDYPTMPLNGAKFYAKWNPVGQYISFNGNGDGDAVTGVPSSVPGNPRDVVDIKTEAATKPVRAGYTFKGWFQGDGTAIQNKVTMPVGGIEYLAKWEPIEQTISFDGNGNGDTVSGVPASIKANPRAVLNLNPSAPSRDGYTFAGWKATDGTMLTVPSNVTMPVGGIVYTAQWKEIKYKVTFNKNSGIDTVAGVPADIEKDYRATVDLTGVGTPTRTGYSFKGWYTSATGNKKMPDDITMPLNGVEYFAQWEIEEYTIFFVDQSGDISVGDMPNSITKDYRTNVTLGSSIGEPKRDGYIFDGWKQADSTNMPASLIMPAQDTTYYTSWKADARYITFVGKSDGLTGTITDMPSSIKKDTDVTVVFASETIKTPKLPGYQFAGWVDGSGNAMPATVKMPASGLTYYTTWTPLNNDIIFDKNASDAVSTQTNLSEPTDSTIDLTGITDPSRDGYTFDGWYTKVTGGTKMPSSLKVPAGTTTYYARWTGDEQEIKFDGGATDVANLQETKKAATGSTVDLTGSSVKVPTRPGYNFMGWEDGSGIAMPSFYTVVYGGTTFYAKWQGQNQTITFDGNGAGLLGAVTNTPSNINEPTGDTVTFSSYSMPTPILAGYTFTGWNTQADGNGTAIPGSVVMPFGGITYYAQWSADSQTISFKNGAGIPTGSSVTGMPAPITKLTNETATGLKAYAGTPTFSGYTFKGWYTNASGSTEMPDSALVPSGGITYYAQWDVDVQSVKFDGNGANVTGVPNAIPAETDAFVDLSGVASPSRVGYQFVEWQDENGLQMPGSIAKMPSHSVTYYAHWSANNYKVIFDGNGATSGSMSDQNFAYDTAQNLTAQNYDRTGYSFVGWNTELNGSGQAFNDGANVVNLTAVNNAGVRLYAQWATNDYTVVFDGNGATSGSMAPQTFTYEESKALSANTYQRDNYTFGGWERHDVTANYTDKEVVSNLVGSGTVTLYAVWNDTYTLNASDFIVEKADVPTLLSNDNNIIAAAGATAVINGSGSSATISVTTNAIVATAGTYQVTFECNGELVTVKATVKDADNIAVGQTYAIQANNIGVKSTDVTTMNNNTSLYTAQSLAKAWTVDFFNTPEAINRVDAGEVQAEAGTYQIYYYTKDNFYVKAFVAVTDADNGKVANKEAIQANNFTIPLSEASTLNSQKYIDESGAIAWKADTAGKVSLGSLTVNSTAVNVNAVGTYEVKYKTNTTAGTEVTGFVTIYDDNYAVKADFARNEAIEAKDFVIDLKDINSVNEPAYILNSDAHGWSADGMNSPVIVTHADSSKVEARKGVYPVTYSTDLGTEVVAYVSVGDGDVVEGDGLRKEMIQANHFTVTKNELVNGITLGNFISKGSAFAWNWDENGATTPITNLDFDKSQVVNDKGTYPVIYTTPSGIDAPVMMTVQTGDEITVDMDKNEVIQASNFQVKQYKVQNGDVDAQYCFDNAKVSAWSADGFNTPLGIDMTSINFASVLPIVGHYPVTFQTTGPNAITVTIDVEVTANNITTVTFDGNGATTEASPYTIGIEEPLTTIGSLPSQNPERIGFDFVNWNTLSNGLGSTFIVGSPVSGDTTVYAQWSRNQYVLSFDTQGGGANPSDQTLYYEDLATQPSSDPSKKGNSFIGWYTEQEGGTYWDFDTTTMPGQNTTLYAHYTVNNYIVTFDQNFTGGLMSKFYKAVPYEAKVPEPETPRLYGYTFMDWEDESGSSFDFATSIMPDHDITLVGQWQHTEHTLTLVKYDYEVLGTYTLYAGDSVPLVTPPSVPGFTFASWQIEGSQAVWNPYSLMPDRNLTLVATYDRYVAPEPPVSSTVSKPVSKTTSSVITNKSSTVIVGGENSTDADVNESSSISTNSSKITSSSEAVKSSTISSSQVQSESIPSSAVIVDVVTENDTWSLLAIILTIASIALGIVLLLVGLKEGNHKVLGIIGILLSLVSVVLFFIFNKLGGTMVFFNKEALSVIAMVIIQAVLLFLVKGNKGQDEDDQADNA